MRDIQTNDGTVFYVSDEDYDYINVNYTCYIDSGGYVYCLPLVKSKEIKGGKLHAILMKPPKGKLMHVDHKNGDKMDNTRENLRICTHQENMRNRKPNKKKGTSDYKGVYFCKQLKKWKVSIFYNNTKEHLGYYSSEIAAANCYNYYAKKYYGEFANLNEVENMEITEWEGYLVKEKSTSKYIGVSKFNDKFVTQIWNGKKNIRVGIYESEIDAAKAYDEYAKTINTKYKRKLNFG